MKSSYIIFALIAVVYLNTSNGCSREKTLHNINVVNFEQLAPEYTKNDNTLYVVNFWATWCAPCVKELPYFMEVNSKFKKRENFKMILVSLDDVDRLDDTVKEFIQKMNLDVNHFLLDDITRMNDWIPAVDSTWSGSIPATLFIKNGKTLHFVPSAITKEELEETIIRFL